MEVLTANNSFHHHLHLLPPEVLQAFELAARWGIAPQIQDQIQSIVSQLLTVGETPEELKTIAPEAFYLYLNRPVIGGVLGARNIPPLDIPFLSHAITVLTQFLSNIMLSRQAQAGFAYNQTPGLYNSWGGPNMYPGYNPQPQLPYNMSGAFQAGNVTIPTPICNYCGVKTNPGNAVVLCMTCSPIGNSHDTCTKCAPTQLLGHCGHRATITLPGYDKSTIFVCARCQSPIEGVRYQCRQCSEERGDSWNLCGGCIAQSPCASHLVVLWKQNGPREPQELIQLGCFSCGMPIVDASVSRFYLDRGQALCAGCSAQTPDNRTQGVLSITRTMVSCFSNLWGVRCEMCACFITSSVFLRCITCGTDLVAPYNLCLLCTMVTGPSLHAGHDMVVSRGSHGCDGCARPINGARYQCRDCSLGAKRREGNAWDLCRDCVRNSECKNHQVKLYCGSMLGQPLIERRMACNGCLEPLNDSNPFWHCLECMNTEWCYNCIKNVPEIMAHSRAHPTVRILNAISERDVCNECMQCVEDQYYISCQTCGTYNEHGFNICEVCIPITARHHVMHQTKIREPKAHEKQKKDKHGLFGCVECGNQQSTERYQCLDCSGAHQGSHNLCFSCLNDSDCKEHTLVVWNYDTEDQIWLRKKITCTACSSNSSNGKPFYLCLTCGKDDSILCPSCKGKRKSAKGHNSKHECVEILDAARPEQRKPGIMCCDSCISYIGDNGSSTFFQCIECTGHNEHSVDLCSSCVIRDADFHKGHTLFLGD